MLNLLLQYLYPDSNMPIDWHTRHGKIMHWALEAPQPTENEIEEGLEDPAFVAWAKEQQCNEIDKKTGREISRQVHPDCGMYEQLGILRDQIGRMLDGDKKASVKFARLMDIALAEIENGKEEKLER